MFECGKIGDSGLITAQLKKLTEGWCGNVTASRNLIQTYLNYVQYIM